MNSYIIKQGGVFQGGKRRGIGETVTLTLEDRELIDPNHTDLQSAEEAEVEATKLEAEAELEKKKRDALAKIDAEALAKAEAEAKKKAAEEEALKKKGGKS